MPAKFDFRVDFFIFLPPDTSIFLKKSARGSPEPAER